MSTLFYKQFTYHSSIFVFPLYIDVYIHAQMTELSNDFSVSNMFLWLTPVGQASTTLTVQQENFLKLSGNMIQPEFHESKKNIYHNQTFFLHWEHWKYNQPLWLFEESENIL